MSAKPTKPSLGQLSIRKAVTVSQSEWIKTSFLSSEATIPFVVQPAIDGMNLVNWAGENRETVTQLLLAHRAVLFRGFQITTPAQLNEFIKATSEGELLEYRDRSSPRHEVLDRIYTSTDYPAEHPIFLHNEGTYWLSWPLKIYFCCVEPAAQGGETPIADSRKIYQRIDAEIRERFRKLKVLYVRNYNDGFGLDWQTVFQTTDRAVVDEFCRRNAIEVEWKDGNRLKTRQVRQAVAQHPLTGEWVWFNHAAFFHVSTLEPPIRDAFLAEFKEEDLPTNTYYGDGTPIEPEVLDQLRGAYLAEKTVFPWEKGDVLVLDNMSVAHGRESYLGKRKVLAGMADPFTAESEK
jgi:alpha-ketoglutarate-dependent taurine dioxygenase